MLAEQWFRILQPPWVTPPQTWLGYPRHLKARWGTPPPVDRQTDGQTRVQNDNLSLDTTVPPRSDNNWKYPRMSWNWFKIAGFWLDPFSYVFLRLKIAWHMTKWIYPPVVMKNNSVRHEFCWVWHVYFLQVTLLETNKKR